ncbi:1-acyl-sn-glycerol-3-phosphate acyltransferase [Bacillus licheniformis]|uniref:lysophospholipid acyltransferase family protein n=1 Tax=Bacillus licheniformis TaxID=1402 RepID=UPI0002E96B36|nr:lysophospholipid acyltransferase family protein [Bacillus licheniformis]KAA0811870.1 1-acyl-sn-glycerol-3-phosphate acyltransferase [Bacillus licheniformis]KAA0827685.1 1-acyl-sn-glycerol-3-phosphate acyltransferase [Bacillus licheniformis]KAA0839180.1 1-acyl-sn-glycerol-3-phosphate acyltransferase [Bacillus licheniformis]MBU8782813.1 1-acyl-sn-glycerol-3-phosphate acyltransferase [Bacillus licheniformis]PSS54022.1 1-acyl-sn-glycerol-3-phosphate acyltransferase [Bacillus licheniformis]
MYQFTGYAAKAILSLRGGIKVYNKENLPKDTGFVIACTHAGWVDVVALGVGILPMEIHYMAKKELFENKLSGSFLSSINAFPVDRENPGPSSIKTPIKLLKEGKIVGIFPSGTRSSEDVPLKRGAVTIAQMGKAPLVPAAYSGPSNGKELFKRGKMKLIIGEPLNQEDFAQYLSKEKLVKMTEALNDSIKALEKKLEQL